MRTWPLPTLLLTTALTAGAAWCAPNKFPPIADTLPSTYTGPVFQRNTDYPSAQPPKDAPWESIDVRKQPREYVEVLWRYLMAGMKEADYIPGQNRVHTWYHMPWHHTGRRAREATHGLSRQADIQPFDLSPTQTDPQQKWELTFFNATMAWQQGRLWRSGQPDLRYAEMPPGTLVAKYIFVTGDDTQLPMLKGAPTWQAHVNCSIRRDGQKCLRPVRLIQIDIAVRDEQVRDTTSWVMTTFVYDRNKNAADPWQRFTPLGVQWGNDPGITPADIQAGQTLRESVIFHDAPAYALARLGWAGRLNGPTDKRGSACLSCHATATWPPPSSLTPPPKAPDHIKLHWFRNIKPDEPFEPGRVPLDYSLHLMNALKNVSREGKPILTGTPTLEHAPWKSGKP